MPIERTSRTIAIAPGQAAKTSDFETVLESMFAAAQAAGESFLDVTAHGLAVKVCGTGADGKGRAICCKLMKRMMIPGDADLSACSRMHSASLLIRYRLPR